MEDTAQGPGGAQGEGTHMDVVGVDARVAGAAEHQVIDHLGVKQNSDMVTCVNTFQNSRTSKSTKRCTK